jgi:hypothetical protein
VVPVSKKTFRLTAANVLSRLTPRTAVIVASAVTYPHGVLDDVRGISNVATRCRVCLHVDACLGGFVLPFMRHLRYEVPPFDFSLPGVSSMSADTHKCAAAAPLAGAAPQQVHAYARSASLPLRGSKRRGSKRHGLLHACAGLPHAASCMYALTLPRRTPTRYGLLQVWPRAQGHQRGTVSKQGAAPEAVHTRYRVVRWALCFAWPGR